MKRLRKFVGVSVLLLALSIPLESKADLFGGDVAVLTQILMETIQELAQLQSILRTGSDTLGLLRDINSGVKSGLNVIHVINPRFNPGVYGNLNDVDSVLKVIKDVYGESPHTADSNLIDAQDQSVAETISMNRNLYDYADQVDLERDRILLHSQVVSPQGAAKLENQSLAVLIGVTTQLLRTQSQMLKLLAQNMALETRKEKFMSKQFQQKYSDISNAFESIPRDVTLPSLNGGAQP